MAPTYDELGRKFVGHEKVKIAKVDCTQEINRELCSEQNVGVISTDLAILTIDMYCLQMFGEWCRVF